MVVSGFNEPRQLQYGHTGPKTMYKAPMDSGMNMAFSGWEKGKVSTQAVIFELRLVESVGSFR